MGRVLPQGWCPCPALQCSEGLPSQHPLHAAASSSPCSHSWHCRGSGSIQSTTCCAKNSLHPPLCCCSQKSGVCHECHCPTSRTAIRTAVRKQSCGIRDLTAHQGCNISRGFSKHLTHCSNAAKLSKATPNQANLLEDATCKQASSPRGARRLPVQRSLGDREPRKRKKTKKEQTNPNALTLPRHLAAFELCLSPYRGEITQSSFPSPSRLGWSRLPVPGASHTFGAWRSSKSKNDPRKVTATLNIFFFCNFLLQAQGWKSE